jgi:hypothetical protein
MYISILKCGPGLLFIWLSWHSVQVELEMPGLQDVCSDICTVSLNEMAGAILWLSDSGYLAEAVILSTLNLDPHPMYW